MGGAGFTRCGGDRRGRLFQVDEGGEPGGSEHTHFVIEALKAGIGVSGEFCLTLTSETSLEKYLTKMMSGEFCCHDI